ncbi:MAG: Phage tail tube protein [Bacteroidota bacterium]|jgi:predicted secreted protein
MATSGVFNGTSLVVLIGSEVVAHATSCSLSFSVDLPETTDKQSGGWVEHLGGAKSWSLTTDGLATVDPAATASYYTTSELMTAIAARTAVTVKFTTVNGTTPVAGDRYWSGSAFIESMDITADMESPVTYSVSFTGTGELTQSTNP